MIPYSQLESLKPLQEQTNRTNQIKSKRKNSGKRLTLTKRARQFAWFGSSGLRVMNKYKGPQGIRSYGNLPLEERK